jgi:hypothetical protein
MDMNKEDDDTMGKSSENLESGMSTPLQSVSENL